MSFVLDGIHPHDAGQVLDELGIAVRTGHHCAWPLHRALHAQSSTRATFYVYNTHDEVDALADGITAGAEVLRDGVMAVMLRRNTCLVGVALLKVA